jgi:hypothetical protein
MGKGQVLYKVNERRQLLTEYSVSRNCSGHPSREPRLDCSTSVWEIRATLEEKGRLIGNNDLWIGAHAMALDVTLATNNEREFKRIAGLSVENWTN